MLETYRVLLRTEINYGANLEYMSYSYLGTISGIELFPISYTAMPSSYVNLSMTKKVVNCARTNPPTQPPDALDSS
jgi:hypothetical protein